MATTRSKVTTTVTVVKNANSRAKGRSGAPTIVSTRLSNTSNTGSRSLKGAKK